MLLHQDGSELDSADAPNCTPLDPTHEGTSFWFSIGMSSHHEGIPPVGVAMLAGSPPQPGIHCQLALGMLLHQDGSELDAADAPNCTPLDPTHEGTSFWFSIGMSAHHEGIPSVGVAMLAGSPPQPG